jgi:hypothetical protein
VPVFLRTALFQVALGNERPPHLLCIGLSVSHPVPLMTTDEGFELGPLA